MRWRKWVSLLALAGVLLHAAAVVRHNATMLTMGGASHGTAVLDALASDLSVICHFGADGSTVPVKKGGPACPICTGLAGAFSLSPPQMAAITSPDLPRYDRSLPDDERQTVQRRYRPPSRGPPSLAA